MNIKNKNKKGFSLIELILVLGISSLAFISFVQVERRKAETTTAEIAGEQLREVGEAVESYITRASGHLYSNIANNTTMGGDLPFTVLQNTSTGACTISTPVAGCYPGLQILSGTVVNRNILGGAYRIRIRNENGSLVGIVTTTNPIQTLDGAGIIKYEWSGAAMKKAGAKSGVAFLSATTVQGYDGAWSATSVNYPNIGTAGQLAYRSQSINAASYDNVYLRLDGAFPMVGNLNMGNFNINNVTDINMSGWLNGNNILSNTLRTGLITNLGNIVNAGTIDSTGAIISRATTETNFLNRDNTAGLPLGRNVVIGDAIGGAAANQGNIYVRDVFLRGGQGATARSANGGTGGWLSDMIPKYVSRGIYWVSVGAGGANVVKPLCAAYQVAKIEVIPQASYVQSRSWYNFGTDIRSTGAWVAYATNLGASWQVYMATPEYGIPTQQGGIALAHVYCDNQF